MRKRNSFLTGLLVVLCLVLLGAAVFALLQILPQKAAGEVSSLETNDVFIKEEENSVEPDREDPYEGDVKPQVETNQEETDPVEPKPDETEPSVNQTAQKILDGMSLEEKIWQMFFVTPEELTGVEVATRAGETTQKALEEKPVGGLIYFAANMEDREQMITVLQNSQSYSKIPLFFGVDEEGGTVSRIGTNEKMGGVRIPAMAEYGGRGDPAEVYKVGTTLAEELSGIGFNVDFAPVADVAKSKEGSVIGSRSFGTDPTLCASMVSALMNGLQDRQVMACLKHFPGYGSAETDAHYGTTTVSKTLEELEACDFLPFEAGIRDGAAFVMVSHISVPNVTSVETPADLSGTVVTDILRNKLGFENVIITDALNMASITDVYTPGEAAAAAILAGVDMVLMPPDLQAAFDGVLRAAEDGRLTESRINESVLRILTLKAEFGLLSK